MPSLTPEEFLDYLKRSKLLDSGEFETALADIKRDMPGALRDSDQLASEFVKRDLLTSWHIRQLMKRKYKGFYLRQYRILGHLGSGGMSAVYLAEHTVMKRRVAIKVLPKRRLKPAYLDRFAREAQAIAALDSQHVVRAYDVDRFEDVHYIVMEYFEGQNLRQLVDKEGPLAYEDAANFIRQAALGLDDAHKIGIVHRDVKPENILVDEHDFVKLLDLGLALLDEDNFLVKGSVVDEDRILGTADYLAPEQALDSHGVDARADVYGLGATLYFCLTGKPPFPEGTITERLLAHLRKEPVSIFTERPDAPIDLVEICSKMMAKSPEDRIQSAEEVADILKLWLIHNGFAQPSDFAQDTNSTVGYNAIDNLISQSNAEQRFLANDASATEMGFERATSGFMLSDAELADVVQRKSENAVDLFDLAGSGGSISKSKLGQSGFVDRRSHSTLSDNLVLSQRTSELNTAVDPLEMALNEIADTTKTPLRTGAASQTDSSKQIINISRFQEQKPQTSQHSTIQPQAGQTVAQAVSRPAPRSDSIQMARDVSSAPEHQQQFPSTPDPFGDWYKSVPVWFWTVAIGGYAVAIFLAGVLLTLLLSIK
ncbi:MAG: serine/threonine protein kinase [Thermoguttaceae bacterium]|jgi:serine/threonine protein kinase